MEQYIRRERYLEQIRSGKDDVDVIKVITGMRRSGKSVLLEMYCNEILDSGVS